VELSNAFKEAVDQENVDRIRIMLKESLIVDPSFVEFDAKQELAKKVKGIYEPHDGRKFNNDKSTWDVDYMNTLMSQLVFNFSTNRVNHLKDVVRKLYPTFARSSAQVTKASKPSAHPPTSLTLTNNLSTGYRSDYQRQKREDQLRGRYRGAQIAGGAVVGAGIGAIAAATASVSVIIGAAVGGVVGGVIASVATSGNPHK
jgi:hypothetical protein